MALPAVYFGTGVTFLDFGMQADVAILSDEALEAALRRSLSCPPRLAGGDDAARFGAVHGYNNKFCADLQRYAVTLADLAALERRESEEGVTDDDEYGLACYELVSLNRVLL